jgi:aryl-alcohol dehydrogenase-like predicted oxidoreductase
LSDERKLDVVEQLIPLAEKADLPMTHLAMAFAIATRASPRRSSGRAPWNSSTTLLAGADVILDDEVLNRIDEIAPPGTDAGPQRRGLRAAGRLEREPAPPSALPTE